MPLNKCKGQMYSFISHTFNTVKGQCSFDCEYCYMKRFKQNPIRLDEKEFNTDLGKGNFIFVGSGTDLFAPDVPGEWIQKTLDYCFEFKNKYLFQSKDPEQFLRYKFPKKMILGTTLESNRWYPKISKAPDPLKRIKDLTEVHNRGNKIFITIEPIMDFDLDTFVEILKSANPEMIAIGSNTSKVKLPEPDREKTLELIRLLKQFTFVWEKDNLCRIVRG